MKVKRFKRTTQAATAKRPEKKTIRVKREIALYQLFNYEYESVKKQQIKTDKFSMAKVLYGSK